MGEACVGVFTLWGDRYRKWYDEHREKIHTKLRKAIQAIGFTENDATISTVFIISRAEATLFDNAENMPEIAKPSLNDLAVAKLQIIRNIIPFKESYACKGVGHLTGLIDPPYDSSEKAGVLKKYLLPRWGPELNNLFIQLGDLYFRPPSWTHFTEEVLRIRRETLEIFSQLQRGDFCSFQ